MFIQLDKILKKKRGQKIPNYSSPPKLICFSFQELCSISLEYTLQCISKGLFFSSCFVSVDSAEPIWASSSCPFSTLILPDGNTVEKKTASIPAKLTWVPYPLRMKLSSAHSKETTANDFSALTIK